MQTGTRRDRQIHRQTSRAGTGAAVQCCGLACRLLTDAKQKHGGGTVRDREREEEGAREGRRETDGRREREGERWRIRAKGGRKEGERERHYRASVSQQVDRPSGCSSSTSLPL